MAFLFYNWLTMAIKPYLKMKHLLHRLLRLDFLIHHKSTGTPADCAQKIGISERSLYDYLRILREMGAPVRFSRGRRTYYYAEGGHFHISFLSKEKEAQFAGLEQGELVGA
ncbi:MAG TPA: HTH domain-containing protein [Puia sp.]|nr:HTH domain-containing protein [Puia sp.]